MLNPANGQIVLGDDQKTGAGDRDKFCTNLYALQNSTLFNDLAGNVQLTPLSDLSASDIIAKIESNSQQGLAARFALSYGRTLESALDALRFIALGPSDAKTDTRTKMKNEWRFAA